ncbi:MAG: right-handed parallel beta-helix repeat-containing protein [Phycisphaeraceae bacterium]|nr:right-handed parallel beta-helix repeat-containing protein [Phycisphaeraceae bacterium]
MPFSPNDLFVSLQGNDSWTGRLAEPNADKTDGPLKTIEAARDIIRERKGVLSRNRGRRSASGLHAPMTVWIRGGRYHLDQPLTFNADDSAPVTYAAYPGEEPILDGGTRIADWTVTKHNGQTCWIADLPDVAAGKWNFRQLFVGGQRRNRPRLPHDGLHTMENVPGMTLPCGWDFKPYTQFVCRKEDALSANCQNLNEVEVVYVHYWIEERSTIAAFDPATRMVTMDRPSRTALSNGTAKGFADYYFDNVFDALSKPGQWYLDRKAGKLYYLPLPGEDPKTTEVYAPRLLQLLALQGRTDEGKFVEFLRFQGLKFVHTDWRHPDPSDGAGHAIRTSGDNGTYESRRHYRGKHASAAQGACDVPGVIFMEAARHIAIENCAISHIGWYAIEVADASHGIRIAGNVITDMGAGGIRINGASAEDPQHRVTGHVRISDNHISAGGRVFHSAIGVLSMNAHHVHVRHNHIHDLFYSGVSMGWVWGFANSVSCENLVEHNHIHDIGQGLLSDMGGVYLLGVQPGTIVRGNLIHDINMAHYGAWCLYTDEGSSHIVLENNVCFRTNDQIYHQHYGRENFIFNNIFAFGGKAQFALSRADPGDIGYTFWRNIVITDGIKMYSGNPNTPAGVRIDYNTYWDIQQKPLVFFRHFWPNEETYTLEQWRDRGFDRQSVVADPKITGLLEGKPVLAPDSPALKLGFVPFELRAGVRPADQRVD